MGWRCGDTDLDVRCVYLSKLSLSTEMTLRCQSDRDFASGLSGVDLATP
jgi:hypothetical protein